MISILECPNRLDTSFIKTPALAKAEAWECRKSWILIVFKPALVEYSWFFLLTLVSLTPPQTLKSAVKLCSSCCLCFCSFRASINGTGNCIVRIDFDVFAVLSISPPLRLILWVRVLLTVKYSPSMKNCSRLIQTSQATPVQKTGKTLRYCQAYWADWRMTATIAC